MQESAQKSIHIQPHISLKHVTALTGPKGLYQHAYYHMPRLEEGYCTDDNARAISVLTLLEKHCGEQESEYERLLRKCWDFLVAAQNETGTFRNFRAADGTWLDKEGSEDTQARVTRALTITINHKPESKHARRAHQLLQQLLPHLQRTVRPRAWAETLIALNKLPAIPYQTAVTQTINHCLKNLTELWERNASASWPWFEPAMTYANALLPHGLIAATRHTSKQNVATACETSSHFLIERTIYEGVFHPVGNEGWYLAGAEKSTHDQQPIEAATMFDFLLTYHNHKPDCLSPDTVVAPYLWFFGNNSERISMADVEAGACADGLKPAGYNPNCGAESLLAYLHAEALIYHAPPSIRQHAWARRMELPEQKVRAKSPT